MATHQLPQISNEDRFEELICDLFNTIDSTNTYKKFGRKGHQQKVLTFSLLKKML